MVTGGVNPLHSSTCSMLSPQPHLPSTRDRASYPDEVLGRQTSSCGDKPIKTHVKSACGEQCLLAAHSVALLELGYFVPFPRAAQLTPPQWVFNVSPLNGFVCRIITNQQATFLRPPLCVFDGLSEAIRKIDFLSVTVNKRRFLGGLFLSSMGPSCCGFHCLFQSSIWEIKQYGGCIWTLAALLFGCLSLQMMQITHLIKVSFVSYFKLLTGVCLLNPKFPVKCKRTKQRIATMNLRDTHRIRILTGCPQNSVEPWITSRTPSSQKGVISMYS